MTNDRRYSESINPPWAFSGRRDVTERYQKRPLKQLSDRSETPAAASA